jgi:hypothetical protein
MDTLTSTAPYLLLFRNSGPDTHRHLSTDERETLILQWRSWYDNLAAQGKVVDGRPLDLETRVVSGPNGARVTDGPFAEAKEAIGGFVVVEVSSREEATQIAQSHPGLAYGLIIEVRRLAEHCHLGIMATQRGSHGASATPRSSERSGVR